MKKTALTLGIMSQILLVYSALAETVDNAQINRLNQLDAIQQQRQQQQLENKAQQLSPQSDVRLDISSSQLSLPENESPCYPIQHISLMDYGHSDQPSQFQWAYQQAKQDLKLTLPHCLGGEGIGILMKQIQNNLVDKGYVTTRVVAEEQDLRTGKLVLTVILGKVRHIIVEDRGNVPRFTRLHSFTGIIPEKGDLLNLRDIEQSLENLKRVPTVDANIEILPSDEVGESDLKISYAQSFPFRLNIGLDDSSSKSTGKWQASGSISWDNIFSANDLFYTSFTHSIKRHTDEEGQRASKSLAFYYSIPFDYWQLSLSHSQSRYHQEVFGAFNNNYLYSGESKTTKATLSYLLYRDAVRKTTLSGGFWLRASQNYIDKAEIEVQRRRMAGWEAGIEHKEFIGDGTLVLNAQYKRGTGASGALRAPEEFWHEGTSRPKILTAFIQFTQPFNLGKQPWKFNTSWNAQWNKTPLIVQDRFSIGGRYTVRGFDGELSLSGDRGWLWRNELSWNVNGLGHALYLGVDAGRVSGAPYDDRLGNHLVGAVIGIRGSWKGFYYDYFVGKPISKPTGFKTSNSVTGFNIGYSF